MQVKKKASRTNLNGVSGRRRVNEAVYGTFYCTMSSSKTCSAHIIPQMSISPVHVCQKTANRCFLQPRQNLTRSDVSLAGRRHVEVPNLQRRSLLDTATTRRNEQLAMCSSRQLCPAEIAKDWPKASKTRRHIRTRACKFVTATSLLELTM